MGLSRILNTISRALIAHAGYQGAPRVITPSRCHLEEVRFFEVGVATTKPNPDGVMAIETHTCRKVLKYNTKCDKFTGRYDLCNNRKNINKALIHTNFNGPIDPLYWQVVNLFRILVLLTMPGDVLMFFSDEAHFHLPESENKQNMLYWSTHNSRQLHQRSLHLERVTV